MKDKLRELSELDEGACVPVNRPNLYAAGWNDCRAVVLAILDADGDGVAVAAWQFQSRDGTWHEFTNEKHRLATEADGTWPIRALYTHPARSGVVSDEDVASAMQAYIDESGIEDTRGEDYLPIDDEAMLAALRSFVERNRK